MTPFVLVLILKWSTGTAAVHIDVQSQSLCERMLGEAQNNKSSAWATGFCLDRRP